MPTSLIKDNIITDFLEDKCNLRLLTLEQRSLFYRALFEFKNETLVVVCENLFQAQQLHSKLVSAQAPAYLYAVEEALQMSMLSQSRELLFNRLQTIERLQGMPLIIITHPVALTRPMSSFDKIMDAKISLKVEQEIEPQLLKSMLQKAGYQKVVRVQNPFEFAFRGSIIDVMTTESSEPYRIEFFDNYIESIRLFSLQTQHSIDTINEINIFCATEHLLDIKETHTIEERLHPYLDKTLAICEDEESLHHYYQMIITQLESHSYFDEVSKYYQLLDDKATTFIEQVGGTLIIEDMEMVEHEVERYQHENSQLLLDLAHIGQAIAYIPLQFDLTARMKSLTYHNVYINQVAAHTQTLDIEAYERVRINLKHLVQDINGLIFKGYQVIICEPDKQDCLFLQSYLADGAIEAVIVDSLNTDARVAIATETLSQSIVNPHTKQAFLKVAITKTQTQKTIKSKYEFAQDISHIEQLEKGDYVVHEHYGIGKYMGLTTLEVQSHQRDFLHIAYHKDDILYVPLENFKFVKKFVSKDGFVPKVNALNSGDWEKTKRRVKQKLVDIVDELLAVQAARKNEIGFAFASDTPEQTDFEASFIHDLTADQKQSIKDVKTDMESAYPMDRLICGDVGFGKTEVAIRAVFKAVMSSKQVAFLCPTTILARQHTETLMERFKDFPIIVENVSRFKTTKEIKDIIERLKEGKIDVVVGTHRLLSKDIVFHDLGLLVIDEEQRFGVVHKEKMKQLKVNVDILTLSATPIPRTLQMSLMELKSLSLLEVAPKNRLPIQTYVVQNSKALVKAAIEKELARKGKVFYLHNDTEKIYGIASEVQTMIPFAKVGIIHGKMAPLQIEKVITGFLADEFNVLVCTTIIETGLDIEGADTILIDNADRFGLSQLYQIKGRVGRRDRIAYAYLMVAPQRELNQQANLRLQAIQEFTRLGSSYQIAMRDLSIRGAGDVLGAKQAGFIDNVGIDLYLKLLQEVKDEHQKIPKPEASKHFTLPVDMYIPKEFEVSEAEKLEIYQSLERLDSFDKLEAYVASFIDMYGQMSDNIEQLILKKQFDLYCDYFKIENVIQEDKSTVIVFSEHMSNQFDGQKMFVHLNSSPLNGKLTYQSKHIRLKMVHHKNWLEYCVQYLAFIKKDAMIGVI